MLKTLCRQIKEYKKASILTPVFVIGEVIMETIIPLFMASIVDHGVGGNNGNGNMNHIILMGGLMLISALLSLLFGILGSDYGAKASAGFARNLRKSMYAKIQDFGFSNIDKYSPAGLVTRLTTDVTNMQNAYQMVLRMCMRAPTALICAMVMSYLINPRLASVYLIAVIFLSIILNLIIHKATKYFSQAFPKYDALNESVQENVSAIRVVKAYVREDYEISKFKIASDNIYKIFCKAESIALWNSPVMNFAIYACILTISWLGAHMIIQDTLTTGQLMNMLTYCMNILISLMMLSIIFVVITMSVTSARRICEVLEEDIDMSNPLIPVTEVKDGSIVFEHVSFRYQKDSEKYVLKGININIKSGETIGIIGSTGSAKSSLVNLISRLYDVTEGNLLVGGINVKEYDLESLRNQVAVVLQNNVLFSGTIMENLKWGDKNATDEECRYACKLACADEFIQKLPHGYNTYIEQGGTNISGGQKQRLCIARALLKKPKILIFDDSTSAVDTETDSKIRKAIIESIPDTTKLIIAQRISSIEHSDRIIVMHDGQINGCGTHEHLLETNLIYQEVYEGQMQGKCDFDEQKGVS